jgi:hypothetical protein
MTLHQPIFDNVDVKTNDKSRDVAQYWAIHLGTYSARTKPLIDLGKLRWGHLETRLATGPAFCLRTPRLGDGQTSTGDKRHAHVCHFPSQDCIA